MQLKAASFLVCLAIHLYITQKVNTSKVNVKKETSSQLAIRLKNGQIVRANKLLLTEYHNDRFFNEYIVYEFLSVPFAQAPLNEKRFQFPFKLDKLLPSDLYESTFFRDSCMQELDSTYPGFSGSEMWNAPGGISEDCLYMNIWVPVKKEQDKLLSQESEKQNPDFLINGFTLNSDDKATLFWVYGGSFSSGSANLYVYDGATLAGLENVIVVSPNYRVGPFGFIYLNNEKAPGNAGLADIALALEWYRDNYLEFFGGSFNKICLFGESAGAMAIHNLLLTDKRSLFNRAILESSSSYLEYSYRNKEDSFQLGLHFAEKVGCLPTEVSPVKTNSNETLKLKENKNLYDANLNQKIVSCLLKQNATYLSQKQWEVQYVNEYLKMQFVPTISDYNDFLVHDPSVYDFKQNKLINHDILSGVNENEGTYFLFYLYNNRNFNLSTFFNETKQDYNNEFVVNKLAESMRTVYPLKSDTSYYDDYVKCISSLYTVNGKQTGSGRVNQFDFDLNTEANRMKNSQEMAFQKLSRILGDYIFACPTIKLANKYSEARPDRAHFYKLSQRARANPWPKWLGVMHAQEIEYVFGLPLLNATIYDNDDAFTSRNIMNYWANYARTGKLTSKYDTIKNRELFVDFSIDSSKLSQSSEWEQFNSFNRLHMNCDLINQFEAHHTYKARLRLCQKHHESIGFYFNSSSSTILIRLSLNLIYFLFIFAFNYLFLI